MHHFPIENALIHHDHLFLHRSELSCAKLRSHALEWSAHAGADHLTEL